MNAGITITKWVPEAEGKYPKIKQTATIQFFGNLAVFLELMGTLKDEGYSTDG